MPPEAAFAYLADPTTARVIDPAIRSYEPDEVPMRVGTTIAIRLAFLGVPVRATSVVEAWEPGRRMAFRQVRPARPVRVAGEHRFEPAPGGCTYTWTITVEPVGVVGRAAAPVARWLLGRNAAAQHQRFARAVVGYQ